MLLKSLKPLLIFIFYFMLLSLSSTHAYKPLPECPDDGMGQEVEGSNVSITDETNPVDRPKSVTFSGKWYVKQVTSYMMDLKQSNDRVSGTIYAKRNNKLVKAGEVKDAVVSSDGLSLSGKWYWNYDPANRPPGAQEHLSKDGLELVLKPTLNPKKIIIEGLRIDPPFKRRIAGSNINPGW